MQKLKQNLLVALTALILLHPSVVLAQGAVANTNTSTSGNGNPVYQNVQQSITSYLCTPSDTNDGRDLERCVNKLYRFGIAFGAIALVFFVVYAGYLYITGGETGKGNAKGVLKNALVGMAILLSSYVLLRFINPELVIYKPIQPPIFTAADLPSCNEVGLGVECVLPGGQTAKGDGSGGGSAIITCNEPLVKVKSAGINVYFGKDPTICPSLLMKMKQFDQLMKAAKITWGVTATVEGGHLDSCHTEKSGRTKELGTCFDLDVPAATANKDLWNQTCRLLKQSGLNGIVNEAVSVGSNEIPDCGVGKRYPTSKGDSLHINGT